MPHRWCSSASVRRNQIESGLDITFCEVFMPIFRNKIMAIKPARVLEIGCGTGHLSKELSKNGIDITAIEPSKGMFEVASEVLSGTNVRLLNCASFDLENTSTFDLAFSHLVAHVVDDISAFFTSIAVHLDNGSYFLFSIPHPCFYNDYKKFFGDEYHYMKSLMKNVSFSITKDPETVISDVPYHHRSISIYVNELVSAGFNIVGFDETFPDKHIQEKYGAAWESPRYCIFICKKALTRR